MLYSLFILINELLSNNVFLFLFKIFPFEILFFIITFFDETSYPYFNKFVFFIFSLILRYNIIEHIFVIVVLYWKGHFWSPNYFLASVGEVKLEDVKRYVEKQGTKDV